MNTFRVHASDLTLTWNPSTEYTDGTALTGFASYTLYYGVASGNYDHSIDVGNETTYQITNLADGFNYYFVVTATDMYGIASMYSNEYVHILANNDTSPPVISGVYVNNITSTSATINWVTDKVTDAQVEYGFTQSYEYTTSLDSALTTNHSQTISVAPSTQYNYRVISSDASGNLSASQNYTFTSAEQIDLTPPVISNIQVNNITSSSATISWVTDDPSTSQVEYGFTTSYENQSAYDPALVTVHAVDITGLSSNSTYNFRVKSLDRAYNEALSDNYTFSISKLPPTINEFSANPIVSDTYQTVTLTGSAIDSDGYIVSYEWDFDGDGNYDSDTGSDTSAFFSYANAGIYNARLRVKDNGGATALSNIVKITIDSPVNEPPVISSLTAKPSSGSVPLLVIFTTVVSAPDMTEIKYEWDFDGNGTYEVETDTNPISYTYNSPGTYTAKVRITDSYGGLATGDVTVKVYKNSSGEKGSSSDNGNDNGNGRGKKIGHRNK
jgi:hypothetical protein